MEIYGFRTKCFQQIKTCRLVVKNVFFLESFDPPEVRADSWSFFKLSDPVLNGNPVENQMIHWVFGLLRTSRGSNRDSNRRPLRSALTFVGPETIDIDGTCRKSWIESTAEVP